MSAKMQHYGPGMGAGDRIPNFKRYDCTGNAHVLHNDLHHGQPILLLVATTDARAKTAPILRAFDRPDLLWETVDRIALFAGDQQDVAQLVDGHSPGFPLLVDDGSLVEHLLGSNGSSELPPGLLALDANLRVLERMEVTDTDAIDALLAHFTNLYQPQIAVEPEILNSVAPVLLIPRVLSTTSCNEFIESFERDGGHPSGVLIIEGDRTEWRPDPDTKVRRDMEITEGELHSRIQRAVGRHVLPEIAHCFNYQVTRHEAFKMICYDANTGGYFRPHRDNVTPDAAHRQFAMTINLNTGDYEGGELCFPEYGPHLYAPEPGGAIVFSCSLVHEARDVVRGKRYALLGFFFDDAAEAAAAKPA